ncbi:HNH endonuclease signature motif containing protein [Chromobacterium haemolyticum]|uniref:HNH endonuclease signature motif containing protein n=1 Tax=Chromobacterium TaxID=535 RepID=UPI004056C15F
MKTGNTGRKAAQRIFKATACERCGSTETLQRHHKDRNPANNSPENVEILCLKCHKADHMLDGTWGRGTVEPATCKVCSQEFLPKRTRRSSICGAACLAEWGRVNAAKRWNTSRESQPE